MKTAYALYLALVVTLPLTSEVGYIAPWGKDREMADPAPAHRKKREPSLIARIALQIILFHQHVLSPVDGPRSHFYPSSSNYMFRAIQDHGGIKGFVVGCDRLLRENREKWVYKTTIHEGKLYKFDPSPPFHQRKSNYSDP